MELSKKSKAKRQLGNLHTGKLSNTLINHVSTIQCSGNYVELNNNTLEFVGCT